MTAVEAAESLIHLVHEYSDVSNFADGCSDEMVRAAEEQLGVVFPPSYRRVVHELGTRDIAGLEFLGVYQTPSMGDQLLGTVRDTLALRAALDLPPSMFQVKVDDLGFVVVDTAELDNAGEGPVLDWAAYGGVTKRLGDSFGEYALEACRAAVRDETRDE